MIPLLSIVALWLLLPIRNHSIVTVKRRAYVLLFFLSSTECFYCDYFVQVSSNLSDNGKHKILTNQSCLSLIFIIFFLSTLPAILFLKHIRKDQVAVFTLGISICNIVLQSIKVCMWLNPFVFHYLVLIIIYLLICVFSQNSHNKENMSLCFSLDKITHDFVVRDFFSKTTSSCYITVDKFRPGCIKRLNWG